MYPGLICLSLNANHRTGESSGEMRHQFALPTHPLHRPQDNQKTRKKRKKEKKNLQTIIFSLVVQHI
jgi:hypothetical protein